MILKHTEPFRYWQQDRVVRIVTSPSFCVQCCYVFSRREGVIAREYIPCNCVTSLTIDDCLAWKQEGGKKETFRAYLQLVPIRQLCSFQDRRTGSCRDIANTTF